MHLLKLSERSAQDLFELQELIDDTENKNAGFNLFISAVTVKQSLIASYKKFGLIGKIFNYFKYHKSEKWIMKNYTIKELSQLVEQIMVLEGVDMEAVKKKLNPTEFPEQLAKD